MFARLLSAAVVGVEAILVQVEVHIGRGLPGYAVVGLPDESVRESRERVRSALLNSGYDFPARRVTVNLAPADIRKEGPAFDLPIALGILASSGLVPQDRLPRYLAAGELSLTGEVRPVRGVLPMAAAASTSAVRGMILARENYREASVMEGLEIVAVKGLPEAAAFLRGEEKPLPPEERKERTAPSGKFPDFGEVRGQAHVKRALEVAAAGCHNILLIGPPGAGKTMMARRLPGILPPLSFQEALETSIIHSVAGLLPPGCGLMSGVPFRSPHHTVSYAGLVGGGSHPRPGEASLANNGVLFLDELPEFSRRSLEALRQPLEEGRITISRAAGTLTYPAGFMLVGAMNPCPCGYMTDPRRECLCTPPQIRRYLTRVSGPLLDRIDMHIDVPPVVFRELSSADEAEPSRSILDRVEGARKMQRERYGREDFSCNGRMTASAIRRYCVLSADSARLMEGAMKKLGLSARAYGRILRVSRTIADLESSPHLLPQHLAEAVQYRSLDRQWG